MARSIPLFRLAGIRVTIDPSWFVIFALLTYSLAVGYLPRQLPASSVAVRWILGAALAGALFASVVAHEYSHALVARRRRIDVDEIMLFVFGGVAKIKAEPEDAKSEFLIAAAGPALSLALGAGLLGLDARWGASLPPAARVGLWWLGAINVGLALFNLVPGFPLDGGRILRAILWWRGGDFERATIGAARTGQVIAGLLIGGGLLLAFGGGDLSWLWEVLIGWFLWSAAARSVRMARLRDAVEGVFVRDILTERVPAIRADHDVRVGLAQAAGIGAPQVAVIESDGRLAGVVDVADLEAAARERPDRLAREVATPPDPGQILDPGDSAEVLVTRLATLEDRIPLVVEDGRLVGTIDGRALVAALSDRQDLVEGLPRAD